MSFHWCILSIRYILSHPLYSISSVVSNLIRYILFHLLNSKCSVIWHPNKSGMIRPNCVKISVTASNSLLFHSFWHMPHPLNTIPSRYFTSIRCTPAHPTCTISFLIRYNQSPICVIPSHLLDDIIPFFLSHCQMALQ